VRPTLGVLAAAVVAALSANILGEYELTPVVAVVAGLVVGFGLAELVLTVGRWPGLVPAVVVGVLAACSLLWAGWIDTDEGVEPYRATTYVGAVVAAATAAVRTARAPART
jgi:hypothetical protein